MSRRRSARTRAEITASIQRVEQEEMKEFGQLAGLEVHIGNMKMKLSAGTLQRWAREGRARQDREKVYLDAILRGDTWFTSEAAVQRFLAALRQRQAG